MTKLLKPSAIFLDWDGTLVDSFSFLHQAHNHARSRIGMDSFGTDEFLKYFGMPREQLYRQLYGDQAAQAKKYFEEFVTLNHLQMLKPLPGASDLMDAIVAIDVVAGVVSNKKGDFIRREIDHFGWTPRLAAIVGAGEAPQDKPAADPLLLAISLSNVKENMNSIWYVGDSETDMLCAKNAGCVSVLIDSGHNNEWVARYEPALQVKNCTELADFLLQWREN
jgi:phosphoglycolate phosphatase